MNWLKHFSGYSNAGWASLWGGLISDVPIFGGVGMLWWHHTCHQAGCYRIGRHPVAASGVKVCRKHHPGLPAGKLSAEIIHDLHRGSSG